MASSAIAAFTRLAEARPPERPSIWFDTACVLGGSVAGLLAARVLADHGRRVVVIERDVVSTSTAGPARVCRRTGRSMCCFRAAGGGWSTGCRG